MEYLVTMTTHVPDATPEQEVNDVRARELAAQGHLLRLFRPPLAPGEWRTLGPFAAGADRLEEVLASMPLRVWRTDDVTPLSPHPNDPGLPTGRRQATEFLTTFTITVPEAMPGQAVRDTEARGGTRARPGQAGASRAALNARRGPRAGMAGPPAPPRCKRS